jgi:hypothetical protein
VNRRAARALGLAAAAYAGMAAMAAAGHAWSEHFEAFLLLYGLAWVAAVDASRSRLGFATVLAGAALFRGVLVPLAPSLSGDLYRYVWEGRVQAAGFDPYVLPPAAPALAFLRDADWTRINHPEATAIYPPLAQLGFRALAAAGGPTLFKAVFAVADLGVVALAGWALRRDRRPAAALALYAWNPLAVVEVAGNGHLEPLGILPLLAAVVFAARRPALAWVGLAASILVKYGGGAVALPFVAQARRPRWRHAALAAGVLLGGFALYAPAGGHVFDSLRLYAEHWRYSDVVFSAVQHVVPGAWRARAVCAALLVGLGLVVWRRPAAPEAKVAAMLAAALVVSPVVHPWYLLWPLAFAPLAPAWPVVVWSGSAVLSYVYLVPAFGIGPVEPLAWGPKLLVMAPVAAAAAAQLVHKREDAMTPCASASS